MWKDKVRNSDYEGRVVEENEIYIEKWMERI